MKPACAIILIFILITLSGCCNNPQAQKDNLNGYWKIQNAETPFKKQVKNYKFSENVDYISIKNDTGYRAKVLPRFDGTAVSNGVREKLSLSIEQDSLRINYKTPFASWQETVLEANGKTLKIKNQRGFIYTYTKYEPINVTQ